MHKALEGKAVDEVRIFLPTKGRCIRALVVGSLTGIATAYIIVEVLLFTDYGWTFLALSPISLPIAMFLPDSVPLGIAWSVMGVLHFVFWYGVVCIYAAVSEKLRKATRGED